MSKTSWILYNISLSSFIMMSSDVIINIPTFSNIHFSPEPSAPFCTMASLEPRISLMKWAWCPRWKSVMPKWTMPGFTAWTGGKVIWIHHIHLLSFWHVLTCFNHPENHDRYDMIWLKNMNGIPVICHLICEMFRLFGLFRASFGNIAGPVWYGLILPCAFMVAQKI